MWKSALPRTQVIMHSPDGIAADKAANKPYVKNLVHRLPNLFHRNPNISSLMDVCVVSSHSLNKSEQENPEISCYHQIALHVVQPLQKLTDLSTALALALFKKQKAFRVFTERISGFRQCASLHWCSRSHPQPPQMHTYWDLMPAASSVDIHGLKSSLPEGICIDNGAPLKIMVKR